MSNIIDKILLLFVALFTGAWIEIAHFKRITSSGRVALFTGAWIEISKSVLSNKFHLSRALYGRVD